MMILHSSTALEITHNKGSSIRSSLQPGEKISLWSCEYYKDSLWGLAGVDIHCHKCTWSSESINTGYTQAVKYSSQKHRELINL